ncbi:MAG: RNB domain-containing ribonuclease [Rhodocyclaceae bacterium]|nr:RNB domain-containing ribonuclease [Rhodocyclaceae bacterium]
MYVLFEEDGHFKAGTILQDSGTSLQVENTHGKRLKLKAAHALLRFDSPAPQSLLEQAQAESTEQDVPFLWEVCSDDEFGFEEFAREYHGRPPNAVESAAVLMALHSAPVYFHRKGRGRYRKAPAEILQAALAGLEKKKQQAEAVARMRDTLLEGRLPDEFAPMLDQIMFRPDRNRLEVKALEAASVDAGLSTARLLLRCGAVASSHDLHFGRFLFEHFPQGTAFPAGIAPQLADDLPLADVQAFSIDDATTTEIDDAFSVTAAAGGGWRVGIHIAAPALGFGRGSELDTIARERLSTVYMPGRKITMLPDAVVECFTLSAGQSRPALSLYLDLSPALAVTGHETRIERVPVVANLRHHDVEPLFNEESLTSSHGEDYPWKRELTLLWELATVLEAGRGKSSSQPQQTDFSFYVDWQSETRDGPGFVTITERQRGSPMDKLVAELMILANATWGKMLAERGVSGLYRVQAGGKVRMSTVSGPHEGLGVDSYAWSSSPLRRYVDLVNQWQLVATLRGEEPPFADKSPDLMAAMRDFELTYAAYAEFQRMMERYWCLRWLRQNDIGEIVARVLRDNVVRLEHAPFVFKVPSMPLQLPGSRVRLAVTGSDLIDIELDARFVAVLSEPSDDELSTELEL